MTSNTGQLCGLTADYGNWLLRSGSKDLSGYLYGTWEFGNGVQAWTNLAVFDSEAQWGTSPPAVQLPAGLDFPAFYDVTSDQQLIGVRQFTAAEVGSQAGLRNRNRERSWDISAGLRGTLANGRFDWDASLGRSYYRVQERISTVNWQRANDYFLGPQLGSVDGLPAYALDRARWWTPLTPGQYAQIGAHSVNRAASWVNQGALSLSGRLFDGWAGPIEFAAVVEAAQQGYRLNPDPRANVDYEVQIDSLLLRGSYATSLRAPDMHYLLGQPSSAQVRTLDQYRCIASGAYQINNCTGDNTAVTYPFAINRRGTPDLESELGDSWTVGFVWDAFENFSFTADYWRIHLDEEIRDIDETTILRDEAGCRTGLTITPGQAWSNPGGADYCASILARVQRDGSGAITAIERGPINLAQRDVSGIDLSARYQLKTAIGDFQMGLDYTNLRSMREQTYRTDPNPERRDRDIRSKSRGSVSWLSGNWNATVYGDRVGAVPGVRSHWGLDRLDNPGGCVPFADGGVPDDRAGCTDTDPASPHLRPEHPQVLRPHRPGDHLERQSGLPHHPGDEAQSLRQQRLQQHRLQPQGPLQARLRVLQQPPVQPGRPRDRGRVRIRFLSRPSPAACGQNADRNLGSEWTPSAAIVTAARAVPLRAAQLRANASPCFGSGGQRRNGCTSG